MFRHLAKQAVSTSSHKLTRSANPQPATIRPTSTTSAVSTTTTSSTTPQTTSFRQQTSSQHNDHDKSSLWSTSVSSQNLSQSSSQSSSQLHHSSHNHPLSSHQTTSASTGSTGGTGGTMDRHLYNNQPHYPFNRHITQQQHQSSLTTTTTRQQFPTMTTTRRYSIARTTGTGVGVALPAMFGATKKLVDEADLTPYLKPELKEMIGEKAFNQARSSSDAIANIKTGPHPGETMEEYKSRVDPEGLAQTPADLELLDRLSQMTEAIGGKDGAFGFNANLYAAQDVTMPGLAPPQLFDHIVSQAAHEKIENLQLENNSFVREFSLPPVRGLEETFNSFLTWEGIKPNSPMYDFQIDIDNTHLLPTKVILTGDMLADIASTQEYCLRNAVLTAKMLKGLNDYLDKNGIYPRLLPAAQYVDRFVQLFPGFNMQNTAEFARLTTFLKTPETVFLNSAAENWLKICGENLVVLNALHNQSNMAIDLPDDDVHQQQQAVYYEGLIDYIAHVNTLRGEVERMTGIFFNIHLIQNSYASPHWCDAFFNPAPHYNLIDTYLKSNTDRSDIHRNSTILQLALAKAQLMWPALDWRTLFYFDQFGDRNPLAVFESHFGLLQNQRKVEYGEIYRAQVDKRRADVAKLLDQEVKLEGMIKSAKSKQEKSHHYNQDSGDKEEYKTETDKAWESTTLTLSQKMAKVKRQLNQLQRPQNWPLLSVVTDEPKIDLIKPIEEVIGNRVLDLTVFEADLKPHLRAFLYGGEFLTYFAQEPLVMVNPRDLQRRPMVVNTRDPEWKAFHSAMKLRKIDAPKTPLVESEDLLDYSTIAHRGKSLPLYAWGGKDGDEERARSIQLKQTADELKESRLRMIKLREIEAEQEALFENQRQERRKNDNNNNNNTKNKTARGWKDHTQSGPTDRLFNLKYANAHTTDLDYNPHHQPNRTKSHKDDRYDMNSSNDPNDAYYGRDFSEMNDNPINQQQRRDENEKGHDKNSSSSKNQRDSLAQRPTRQVKETDRWSKLSEAERISEGARITADYEMNLRRYATKLKRQRKGLSDEEVNDNDPDLMDIITAMAYLQDNGYESESDWDRPPFIPTKKYKTQKKESNNEWTDVTANWRNARELIQSPNNRSDQISDQDQDDNRYRDNHDDHDDDDYDHDRRRNSKNTNSRNNNQNRRNNDNYDSRYDDEDNNQDYNNRNQNDRRSSPRGRWRDDDNDDDQRGGYDNTPRNNRSAGYDRDSRRNNRNDSNDGDNDDGDYRRNRSRDSRRDYDYDDDDDNNYNNDYSNRRSNNNNNNSRRRDYNDDDDDEEYSNRRNSNNNNNNNRPRNNNNSRNRSSSNNNRWNDRD